MTVVPLHPTTTDSTNGREAASKAFDGTRGPGRSPLRVLYIQSPASPRDWLQRTLIDSGAGAVQVMTSPSLVSGLEQLRDQPFDVVLVDLDASDRPAAELLLAIQASTHEHQSVVIMAEGDDRQQAIDYFLAGASAYITLGNTTTQELAWTLHTSAQNSIRTMESEQLRARERRFHEQEKGELLRQLDEQSKLFAFAARRRDGVPSHGTSTQDPSAVEQGYGELLQAYVMMGRGQLRSEVQRLADHLHDETHSLPRTLEAITQAVRVLIRDRGTRSARHVFNRGNVLLFDLLIQWADRVQGSRTNAHQRCHSDL